METQIHQQPRIVAAAERQMQSWARTQEIQDRATLSETHRQGAPSAIGYVSISREAGAGGGEVARVVGERLGWEVLDKNLLDRVAERFHEPRKMLDLVDETPTNWVYDVLGTWMDRRIITHERYVAHLSRVVLAAARHGPVVLVGRGSQFLLPREHGLAVRLVAPEKYRIRQIMQGRGLNEAAARRFVRETDQGRREFVERFFHHDIGDPHLYDLVVNVEHLGPAAAAELVLLAVHQRDRKPAPH
jgi:cytidylate kinase